MPRRITNRRTFLKATGVAAAAGFVASAGASAATGTIDDDFDLTSSGLKESLVVFDAQDDVDRLSTLDLANGYYAFDVLPIGYTELTSDQIEEAASWAETRYVQKNTELEFFNDDARDVTEVDRVQSDLGYAGSAVHTAVIDSGVDGDHPDLDAALVANWKWVGNPLSESDPTLWTRAGDVDTDDNGHGTHCSGTVAGDGTASDGQWRGMAPAADLTVYSTGLTLFILKAVAAYDHLLSRVQAGDTDVKVVSNSYGLSNGDDFVPDDSLNVATWEAHRSGLLSAFAAGNSGPDYNTLNQYAKGPHVLGVAATHDDKTVTDFSSRGRPEGWHADKKNPPETNHDRKTALDNLREYHETGSTDGPVGLYRPGVGTPGYRVMSTMAPEDPLQELNPDTYLYYARISGTSMACPVAAGVASLVVDAYRQNGHGDPAPIDVLNTVAAAAEDAVDSYTEYNIGAGFTDAYDAVKRAESGDLATFADVTLVSN